MEKRLVVCPLLCLAIAVVSWDAAPQDTSLFEDINVVPLPVQTYGYRGMPGSMAALGDGRLLLAYTQMQPDGQAGGGIGARYSSDQGKTWGEEFMLVAAPRPRAAERYCHPSLLRLADGQLLLSYIYVSGSTPLFGHNYYRRSADDGKTWGDQLIVSPRPGYNIMHNDKLVQLSSGRIIAPLEFELVTTGDDHAGYVSYTECSDDNGYSWHSSKNVVKMLPVEAQEPHVAELKDGRLIMLMRTYSGYVARAYSADRGENWSEGQPVPELTLPRATSSALNVKRIPSTGDLLLLRCNNGPSEPPRRRTPFVSVISKDDGQTWENERVIAGDPENDYGYPGLLFVNDMAMIVYHQRDGLHVARISVNWFYGK
jgi:sialidase-1